MGPVRAGEYLYEIERASAMRVPAWVYADSELIRFAQKDRSLAQLANVASLPGVTHAVFAMPDVHEGYGFPVGAVAATRMPDGVISPGGVGYDINCGVRLLASDIGLDEIAPKIEAVTHELARAIPAGMGRAGGVGLTEAELETVLAAGSRFLLSRGMAEPDDLDATESGGALEAADPDEVSPRAKERGVGQLGTLGSGNHFVEVQVVDEIYDEAAAEAFGLGVGRIAVLVHTGSRGLGHQICTDYVKRMDAAMARHGIEIPDRELACAPMSSPEARSYFSAMCAAANFAWANRQAITHGVRQVFARAFGHDGRLRLVYDVAHNIAKIEEHDGVRLCVHRKGATRAFGPGHPDLSPAHRRLGQPVLVPGSMGTASYVLVGTGAQEGFASSCHGAGRSMSRGAARRATSGANVRRELAERGIVVCCASAGELAEEAPRAYKDIDRVVSVVHGAGLARKVARLRPLGVIKG